MTILPFKIPFFVPVLCCQMASRVIQICNINFYTWVQPPPPPFTQSVKNHPIWWRMASLNQQLKKTDINKTTPQLLGRCKSGQIWIFGALGNQLIWGSIIFVHSLSRVSTLKDIALRWHFFLHNGL